ncbi:dihydrofolate reductase [Sulfurirhabdus autotrophica]|uniref:Dihydrofolate reductase n=1 Tax=Sulfurirhabdus autotrophica TaxID=1706046 RepID=A0A4R3Y7E8_9PROT|nr:dihydrofolate reductase [Sulfurirhabdus autotrophica]TCV87441.1 dihydrofolate reductase [Sulfurirhabdus autotrophica]
MSKPRISIIAALAKNRTIGINNSLPWRIPGELKYFKTVTMGHHILMGRKTFESIGKPLPGRTTVIITRNTAYRIPDCIVTNTLDAAIAAGEEDDEIFFVGGAELYAQALPLADRLYLTEIQKEFAGDAHFPSFDINQWHEIKREKHLPTEPDGLEYHFVIYERNKL